MASPATDPSESVRRCDDRSGEPSRSGDPDREPLRVAEGDSTKASPRDVFVRSGELGKTGMLGDMASFVGDGGRDGGSIFWIGDSLRRARMTVGMLVGLIKKCAQSLYAICSGCCSVTDVSTKFSRVAAINKLKRGHPCP